MKYDLPTMTRLPEPSAMTWTYDVAPSEPVVWREVVPVSARRELIGYWHEAHAAGNTHPPAFKDGDVAPADLVAPPDEYRPVIDRLLAQVADHFSVPFSMSSAEAVLARYAPGAGTDWHLDAVRHKRGEHRTVSFSMLLNENFTDGDLVVDPGGVVEMAAGDVCGFTSRTWHRVAPVHSGERFALIAFGGFGR
jgi:alkylated DNA repair dioxygenase AlkB